MGPMLLDRVHDDPAFLPDVYRVRAASTVADHAANVELVQLSRGSGQGGRPNHRGVLQVSVSYGDI